MKFARVVSFHFLEVLNVKHVLKICIGNRTLANVSHVNQDISPCLDEILVRHVFLEIDGIQLRACVMHVHLEVSQIRVVIDVLRVQRIHIRVKEQQFVNLVPMDITLFLAAQDVKLVKQGLIGTGLKALVPYVVRAASH